MTYRITSAERAESEHRAVVKAICGILYDDKADVDEQKHHGHNS